MAQLPTPVGLAGYGVEGRETLAFLRDHGLEEFVVCDRALDGGPPPGEAPLPGVRYVGGDDWGDALAGCGVVVRSPGIRPDHPALNKARDAGAMITSATQLFLQWVQWRNRLSGSDQETPRNSASGSDQTTTPVVGVTGTLGKGTTVTLIVEALRAAGVPARTGGNIGVNPLADLDRLQPGEVSVLELSSFQLMDLEFAHPGVAVVLRTTSEHLDWHKDVQEYRQAKSRLLAPAGSAQKVVCCADSEGSLAVIEGREAGALSVSREGPVENGIGLEEGKVFRYRKGRGEPLPELDRLALPGGFNLENVAAAYLAVECLGLNAAQMKQATLAMAAFSGLSHRLQLVGQVKGARENEIAFYNDSYATRPDATLGAISAFQQPLSVILGGSEKHADFGALAMALCEHPSLMQMVLIGSTAARIAAEVESAARNKGAKPPPMHHAHTLEAAFQTALKGLPNGGVVLFSPACASFDMFPNYKVRGERFVALVEACVNSGEKW